jgi:hypothetical protein
MTIEDIDRITSVMGVKADIIADCMSCDDVGQDIQH